MYYDNFVNRSEVSHSNWVLCSAAFILNVVGLSKALLHLYRRLLGTTVLLSSSMVFLPKALFCFQPQLPPLPEFVFPFRSFATRFLRPTTCPCAAGSQGAPDMASPTRPVWGKWQAQGTHCGKGLIVSWDNRTERREWGELCMGSP